MSKETRRSLPMSKVFSGKCASSVINIMEAIGGVPNEQSESIDFRSKLYLSSPNSRGCHIGDFIQKSVLIERLYLGIINSSSVA